MRSFDGVVEAVRQTALAAQVSGAVLGLDARPGQSVKAGQVLVRLDARAAEQGAVASLAQAQAERAALALAQSELERQRQLRAQGFISAAALERAETEFRASEARAKAGLAQADAARTGAGLAVLRAPYDAVVAEVPAMPGDMALPGKPLMQLYDPRALRVSVALPQGLALDLATVPVRVELTGADARELAVDKRELLPVTDPSTQTQTLRLQLAASTAPVVPGRFVRVWLDLPAAGAGGPVSIPLRAVLRRGELMAVYVLDAQQRPLLRQVRLAAPRGDSVEVLAGLRAGERVVADPRALPMREAQ
jgi:RND family efflux transporter MFP subunit